MTPADIRRCFGVDRSSAVPIYQQLERRLRDFVASAPAGTRLPSERTMSEVLDLSRQTIKNALNILAEARLLQFGRKGTFTNAAGGDGPAIDEITAPKLSFANFIGSNANGAPLKLLLFEAFPNQQAFWTRTVRNFNLERHGITAEIDFLPNLELRAPELEKYLEKHPADLVQCCSYPENCRLLAPLPLDIQHEVADPELFLTRCLEDCPPEMREHLLPVYTNYFCCYYNRNLARKHGIEGFADDLPKREIYSLLEQLRAALPEPPYITGTIGDFILACGVHDEYRIEEIDGFLEQLDAMRGKRLIHSDITMSIPERLNDQFSGRQFFMIEWSSLALHHFSDVDHEIGIVPLQPPPGRVVYGAASFLGVARNSRRQGEATMFLNYMMSPAVQRRIAGELNAVPFHRDAPEFLAGVHPAYCIGWWRDTVDRIRACKYGRWSFFVAREITDLFRDLLSGKVSLERTRAKMHLRYNGLRLG